MNDQSKTKHTQIQKKASLDDALEYAENIIDTIREPLIALDHDLRVVKASRSFYDFFKVKPEETIGQFIYDLGNRQWDIPKLRELLEDILPKKAALDNYEVEHEFTTIGRRVMLLNARQIQRASGKERIILLAIEDITVHKRLENILKESEERYRHLFETANDGIVLLKKHDGTITHANPAAEKMLGYSIKECIGNKLHDIGVMLDMGDFQTTMQNLDKIGIIKYNDVPIKTKSGLYIDTDMYIADRSILVQCNIRDITDRKRIEEKLRKSEENFRHSLDDSPLGVRILTIEGETIYANRSILDIYGYDSIEELKNTPLKKRYAPESYAEYQSRKKKRFQGEFGPSEYDINIVKKNGEIRNLHVFRKEIFWNNTRQFQTLYQDITDRKQKEKALLASQKQLQALASHLQVVREEERTQIARRIHDDMGGVLTSLKIDLSFMVKTALKIENKTIRKSLLDGIDVMIKSIDVTIHEVRKLAKDIRPIIMADLGLIAAMEWQLHDFQKRTNIQCKWISSVKHIKMDIHFSTALFRIFQEVLNNVARHSGATKVRACLCADEESFILEVKDNGKGFKEENLLSSESLGFLGMKERAQIFGGLVTITGKPGIGTTVTVTIPFIKRRKQDKKGDIG